MDPFSLIPWTAIAAAFGCAATLMLAVAVLALLQGRR